MVIPRIKGPEFKDNIRKNVFEGFLIRLGTLSLTPAFDMSVPAATSLFAEANWFDLLYFQYGVVLTNLFPLA